MLARAGTGVTVRHAFRLLAVDQNAARTLLAKLRTFIEESLTDDERVLLGQLLAPGVARAYPEETEVVGFTATLWTADAVSESLLEALRDEDVRVVWGGS